MPDFDWILELPDGWEPPDELRTPSMSIEANLAIRMLSCDYLGHEVRVLLGRFITEHSLFTLWYLREAKSSRYGLKETLMLGGLPREQTRVVYEAWKRFDEISAMRAENSVIGERRRVARKELAAALQAGIANLSRVRMANPEQGVQ
jgi:hypothetical protein